MTKEINHLLKERERGFGFGAEKRERERERERTGKVGLESKTETTEIYVSKSSKRKQGDLCELCLKSEEKKGG